MKKTCGNLVSLVLTLVVIFTAVSATTVTVHAAEYKSKDGKMVAEVIQGRATLSVEGDVAFEIAKKRVAKSIDFDLNDTIYMTGLNERVYWYSYFYQGRDVYWNEIEDAESLILESIDGLDVVTGYRTKGGSTKSIISIEEIRTKYDSNYNQNDSNSSNTDQSSSNDGGTSNPSDSSSSNSSSNDQSSSSNSNTDDQNSSTSSSNSDSSSSSSSDTSDSSQSSTSQEPAMPKDGKVVSLTETGSVMITVTKKGVSEDYVLVSSTKSAVDKYGIDKNGTVWVRYVNNYLDIWNYDLQKPDNKMYNVTDNCTALVVSGKKVTGYYIKGKDKVQKIWSKKKIKNMLTKKYEAVTCAEVVWTLYNGNGERVDSFKWWKNKNKVRYHKIDYKNVKYVRFTQNYNLIIKYKDKTKNVIQSDGTIKKEIIRGKTVLLDRHTSKVKKTWKNIKCFEYSKGFAIKAVKYDKTRFSLSKY